MRYKVVIADVAKDDLKGIRRYFTSVLKSPDTGKIMLQKLKEAMESLGHLPLRHTISDQDLVDRGIRAFSVENYIIFYIVTHETVSVIRVMHSSRNWIDLI